MQVWRKVGSGSPVQIIANDYRNMVRRSEGDYVYPKVGMYWFGSGDPWAGAATGTDMDYDYAGSIVVPVSNAQGAGHTDFFDWLSVRTGV
jgi:hypothetical protein